MSNHATGPRSDAGKERSSLNATQHGLRSERPVIPGENAEEWDSFCASVVERYAPADVLERELAERIALQQWRLRRATRFETQILSDEFEEAFCQMVDTLSGLHPDDPAFQCLVQANRVVAQQQGEQDRNLATRDVLRQLPTLPAATPVTAAVAWLLVALAGGVTEDEGTAGELRELLPQLSDLPLAETLVKMAVALDERCQCTAADLALAKKQFELLTLGMARQVTAREHDRRLLQKTPLERLQRYEAHVSRQLEQARKMLKELQDERRANEAAAREQSAAAAPIVAMEELRVEPAKALPVEDVPAPRSFGTCAPEPSVDAKTNRMGRGQARTPAESAASMEELVRHLLTLRHNGVPVPVTPAATP